MRTGVTLEDVTRAADEILERGERPTVDAVRSVLGTGSPATVNRLLSEYFKTLPKRLHLPAPIAIAAADLFEKLRTTAQDAADERERVARAALETDRERLVADRTSFELERETLNARATALSADLSTARDAQTRLERTLEIRLSEAADLAAKATAAEARALAAADERERSSQNHHSEITRLKDRADGNERHLLAQVDELRDQLKQARADRDREHLHAAKRQTDLEASVAKASDAVTGLRKELATRDAELAHAQSSLSGAQAALAADRDVHSRETAYLTDRIAQVARERDEAAANAVSLQRERDRFAQEAAVESGKRAALEDQLAQYLERRPR